MPGAVDFTDFARLASAPVTATVRGRVRSIDMTPWERVWFAPPDFWRVEDGDGVLRYLANDDGHYTWEPGATEPAFRPRRPGRYWSSGDMVAPGLIHPRDLLDPADDDFTRPAGAIEEIVFLDRPAWRVLLAPPVHKPQPVWQVLDVDSGVTLAYQAPDGSAVVEFVEIETGAALRPAVFAGN